jgi:hypothetical protein
MHAPHRILIVQIALRISLAAAFLSAIADRFGWWAPLGRVPGAAWKPSQIMPISLFRLLLVGF